MNAARLRQQMAMHARMLLHCPPLLLAQDMLRQADNCNRVVHGSCSLAQLEQSGAWIVHTGTIATEWCKDRAHWHNCNGSGARIVHTCPSLEGDAFSTPLSIEQCSCITCCLLEGRPMCLNACHNRYTQIPPWPYTQMPHPHSQMPHPHVNNKRYIDDIYACQVVSTTDYLCQIFCRNSPSAVRVQLIEDPSVILKRCTQHT